MLLLAEVVCVVHELNAYDKKYVKCIQINLRIMTLRNHSYCIDARKVSIILLIQILKGIGVQSK